MSKTNPIFESIPVQIPDRSGFDLSHEVLSTAKCGTIVPITHIEVLPGDTISMGSMMKVTLPPFAVPFMGRVDAELTAFFVPNRLVWNGWQSFITQNNGMNKDGAQPIAKVNGFGELTFQSGTTNVPVRVPTVRPLSAENINAFYRGVPLSGPGSLSDYLGVKKPSSLADSSMLVSALPYLCYHKVCDDWYRDENNMKPFFSKVMAPEFFYSDNTTLDSTSQFALPHFMPFYSGVTLGNGGVPPTLSLLPQIADGDIPVSSPVNNGIGLGMLRQRCWSKDYFTTATTRPQAGADSSVVFGVTNTDAEGNMIGTGSFTIATLRAANSLQKWLERNNIAGTEYGSQIVAHFGVTPPDAVLNRSVLLGSVRTPVVVNSVENNSGNGGSVGTSSPYGNTLGAAAGFGSGFDKGNLVDNFTAKEHGYIMVMFTLIPHAYYNSGVERSLRTLYVGDYAWPEFAGIGDQPIYGEELSNTADAYQRTFGYQQRYVQYKHKLDRISGLLSDGNNLSPYALQRGFESMPELGSDFLEIPTNYLDQVLGVSSDVAGFGCMVDAFFDCSALRVLPEYSLPHL